MDMITQKQKIQKVMGPELSSSKALTIKSFSQAAQEELNYIKKRKSGEIKPLKTSLSKFNKALMAGI